MSIRSFFRGVQRGTEQLREGALRLDESAQRMERRSKAHRARTEGEVEGDDWFARFQATVSASLRWARSEADRDEQLDATPGLREKYERALRQVSSGATLPHLEEPDWARRGMPTVPARSPSDVTVREPHLQGFENARKAHEAFVRDVRSEIDRRPAMRKPFLDCMRRYGVQRVLDEQFEGM